LETVVEPFDDGWPEFEKTSFHLCARMIIVCCWILLPNFGDYCHVIAGKGLGELDPMQLLVFSLKIRLHPRDADRYN
jgi:hypothetical protein